MVLTELKELEVLYLASLKKETYGALYGVTRRDGGEAGPEITAINPELHGKHEPVTVEEAVIFKIEEVGSEVFTEVEDAEEDAEQKLDNRAVYGADVAFRGHHRSRDFLKPVRDDECLEIDTKTGLPKKIIERYTKKGGSKAIWRVGFGFRFSDGTIRMAVVRIEGRVPQMTPEQVQQYYLAESSSGLKLVEFLETVAPHTIFKIRNENGDKKFQAEITLSTVRQLVIDKVPPAGVLQEIISSKEYKVVEIKGSHIGLVSLGLTQWASQAA